MMSRVPVSSVKWLIWYDAQADEHDAHADEQPRRDACCRCARRWASTTIITSVRGISARPDCVAVKPSSSCMNSGSRNMLGHQHREHHRAEQRARGEDRILEEAQVHRGRHRGQLADDEGRPAQTPATSAQHDDRRGLEPVVALPLLEHVLQRGEADAEQRDALPVHVLALLLGAAARLAAQHVLGLVDEARTP